jgi:anti-anti-sigma factor
VERTDPASCVPLVVRGDLDLTSEDKMLAAARDVLRERDGLPLVLDLSGLAYVGSTGFSELLMIRHEATTYGQELRIVTGSNRWLRRLLGSLGPLQSYDLVDDACRVHGTTARP